MFGRGEELSAVSTKVGIEANADFWAAPGESRADIVGSYRRSWERSDATIAELSLDAVGRISWWGNEPVTLQRVVVHVTAETQRHAGHADIVRELIDGSAGLLEGHDNLPANDPAWWRSHHDRIEASARLADGR